MKRKQYFTEEEKLEAYKEAQRRWKEAHPDYYKNYSKKYREEHKDEISEKGKEYRQLHKNEKAEYNKKYFKTPKGRACNLISAYQQQDRNLNRSECTLTPDWVVENIFSKPCHYCGKEGWEVIGCDRIDNSKPHTPDNVVPCCYECNTKRHTMKYEEFYDSRKQLHKDKAIQ